MEIGVTIKSNVMVKPEGSQKITFSKDNLPKKFLPSKDNLPEKFLPPMDNLPDGYFDVRRASTLTLSQKTLKEQMMYWADKVQDKNGDIIKIKCYKGCLDCGEPNNHCKRPQNKQ